jgi:hypothetical protein
MHAFPDLLDAVNINEVQGRQRSFVLNQSRQKLIPHSFMLWQCNIHIWHKSWCNQSIINPFHATHKTFWVQARALLLWIILVFEVIICRFSPTQVYHHHQQQQQHKLGNLIYLHQPQNSTSSISLPLLSPLQFHATSLHPFYVLGFSIYSCSNFVDRIMNLTFLWPMPYIHIRRFLSTRVQYIWLRILKKLWLLLVLFLSPLPNGQKTLTTGTELCVSKLYCFGYVRKWSSHAWLDFLSAWSITCLDNKSRLTHLIPQHWIRCDGPKSFKPFQQKYVNTCIYVQVYLYIWMFCIQTHTHACLHTCAPPPPTHTHTHTHIYIYYVFKKKSW